MNKALIPLLYQLFTSNFPFSPFNFTFTFYVLILHFTFSMQLPIYMDFNATTPVDQRVLNVMLPFFTTHYGNAASTNHEYGWQAAEAVELAREQVAKLIQAEPGEIIFTSGATEAVNLAIKGVYESYASKGNHIITCATEHKAVLDTCNYLEKKGASITYLPVDNKGRISLYEIEKHILPTTILIALMYANNETGIIHPIKEIGALAKKNNTLFFTDATQAIGKTPVNVLDDGIDIMAFSAHKIYGPKGTGALYVRRKKPRVNIAPQIHGGGHQKEMRSGTLNVPGIVGLGKACDILYNEMNDEIKRLEQLRNTFEKEVLKTANTFLNGDDDKRLPNVTNICFNGFEKNALHAALNKYISFSSGSACTSAKPSPSHVLKAMGASDADANSSIRFSVGRFTTKEDINFAKEKIVQVSKTLFNNV